MEFIGTFFLLYLAMITFLFLAQRNLIYFPSPDVPIPAAYDAADMSVINVKTQDGLTLRGWYKKPRGEKPVIVVFHGNASHMGMSAWKVRGLLNAGYGALLPAYRGYAGNPGKPHEYGLYLDARAFIDWLVTVQDMPQDRIVLLGESLGSGVAVEIAAHYAKAVRAVVLETPYTSFADMARRQYPFVPFIDLLLRDKYDNLSKIPSVSAPILFMHGRRDVIVPFAQGRRLYEAAVSEKTFAEFPNAGHNDLYAYGAGEKLLKYLSGL